MPDSHSWKCVTTMGEGPGSRETNWDRGRGRRGLHTTCMINICVHIPYSRFILRGEIFANCRHLSKTQINLLYGGKLAYNLRINSPPGFLIPCTSFIFIPPTIIPISFGASFLPNYMYLPLYLPPSSLSCSLLIYSPPLPSLTSCKNQFTRKPNMMASLHSLSLSGIPM